MDILDIILDIPQKLIELTDVLRTFIFSTVNIAGTDVSFWLLFGGVAITILIIYSIVRS